MSASPRPTGLVGTALVFAVVALAATDVFTNPLPRPAVARTREPRGASIVDDHLAWLVGNAEAPGTPPGAPSTGLALVALSCGGETHQSGTYKADVRRFADSFVAAQESNGCLVPRGSAHLARDHAVAAIGLVEQYGMTGRKSLREPANRAVNFALSLRAADGAWRSADNGPIDLEATAWSVLLLGSARLAELRNEIPDVRDDVTRDLDRITDESTGIVTSPSSGATTMSAAAATALGTAIRVVLADDVETCDPRFERAIAAFAGTPPSRTKADATPAAALDAARHAYFGSVVMLRVGGDRFRDWFDGVADFVRAPAVVSGQHRGAWFGPPGTDDATRLWGTTYKTISSCFFFGPYAHAEMRHSRRR